MEVASGGDLAVRPHTLNGPPIFGPMLSASPDKLGRGTYTHQNKEQQRALRGGHYSKVGG